MTPGEWLHVTFDPSLSSPAPSPAAMCSCGEMCLGGVFLRGWKESLGHDHAQMVKELKRRGRNQGLYLVSLPSRDSKQITVQFKRNSFPGDQVLLQTIGFFFHYCRSSKDSMSFLFRSNGKICPDCFIPAEISRLGFSAIHNFCALCCETKYLTSIADLER